MSGPVVSDKSGAENFSEGAASLAELLRAHASIASQLREQRFAVRTSNGLRACEIKENSEKLLDQIRDCWRREPAWIESEITAAAEIIDTCVTVADYYDNLQAPRNTWLFRATQTYFEALTKGQADSNKCLPEYFQLALVHLQIDYRRRMTEHLELRERFALLQPLVPALHAFRSAKCYRLLRRYYHLRSHVVRQVPERHQADNFLDLAASYADMEALSSDPETAAQVLTEKIVSTGLTRAWLLISSGHYQHALDILALVNVELERRADDPISYAKYLVAKNICLRALAGRDPKRLHQVINGLNEALQIFEGLDDRRHLLRCYYERSMCYLLLGNQEHLATDLKFMEQYAHAGGENRRIGWQIQSNILRSRLYCQQEDYEKAEANAEQAMKLAAAARLDLMTIEAKNTFAVALFRQGKLFDAESQLSDALRINHEGLHQTDHGDLSQPALYGVSLLYLARVALLNNDLISALRRLQEWRTLSGRVEHQWVKNLAVEIEQQLLHYSLVQNVAEVDGNIDFEAHLRLLRKVIIEKASKKVGSRKIVDIANELGVKRQTIHNWLSDLKQRNVDVQI